MSIMLQFHGEKHPSASADGPIHTLAYIQHTSGKSYRNMFDTENLIF